MKVPFTFILALLFFCSVNGMTAQERLLGGNDECNNAVDAVHGLDTLLDGSSHWFNCSIDLLGEGVNAYWYSPDSLVLEAYLNCFALRPVYTYTVLPSGVFSINREYLLQKIDSIAALMGMGSLEEVLEWFDSVKIKATPKNGQNGRLIFQKYKEGPETDCSNPLPVYMDATYILTDSANVYTLTHERQPDSLHVVWQAEDEELDTLPTIQVRYGSCDGDILGEAQTDSQGVYVVERQWVDSAYQQGDTLFFHVFAPIDGKIRFRPVTFTYAEVDTVLCEGKGLQLQDTLLTTSTSYTDTVVKSEGYRHFITHYELEVQPAPETNDTLYVGAAELPLQMQEVWIESEGNYSLRYQTEEGCDSIVHLQVYIQTSLRETSESSLKVYPTLAKTGTPVQIEWPEGYEKASLDLFDLSGRLLWSRDDQPTFILLDKAGAYLLVMNGENGKGQTLLMAHD